MNTLTTDFITRTSFFTIFKILIMYISENNYFSKLKTLHFECFIL